MFLPFNIVALLILSPFIVMLWVVRKVVKLLLRLALYTVKAVLKLTMRFMKWSFLQVKRLLTA